jgi:hypothetical protein
MLETAVVIGAQGEALYWHLPTGRSAGALPDSRTLWSVLWSQRDSLQGVAHTHPGSGLPRPSWTDVTTFAACEDGLGRRLRWWIATEDALRCFCWIGPHRFHYIEAPIDPIEPPWLAPLRERTYLQEKRP